MPADLNTPTKKAEMTWNDALRVYGKPQVLIMLLLGFSGGLPLLLVFSTLSAWLTDLSVSRSTIGFFGWVGITYSIKVFWAPIVDRLQLPLLTSALGQRRSWMLLGQLGIVAGLVLMVSAGQAQALTLLAASAVLVAFSSSTQDIAIDAFRIESARDEYQGAMSATYIFGYRLAMLVAGAGAFYIADFSSWETAYLAMAGLMLVGMIAVLVVAEPEREISEETQANELRLQRQVNTEANSYLSRLSTWIVPAVIAPFADFFRRNGYWAVVILAFIGLYRLSDITMGIMANPFYLDLGFTKSQIASVGKVFGFVMTILGSFAGGLIVVRYGIHRPLIAGAIMVAVTNILFAQLAGIGPDIRWLALVISADNLSAGFANAAFIAYLSSLTNRAYTATQYALFSSLMTLPGKFLSGFSGIIVDTSSYEAFFLYAAMMGLPAIVLSVIIMRHPAPTKTLQVRET